MKTFDFKKQLLGLNAQELTAKAREITSLIAKNKLELAAGKLQNKRAVFNLRKQVSIIKTKIYESTKR